MGPESNYTKNGAGKIWGLKQITEVALVWGIVLGTLVTLTVRASWQVELLSFLALATFIFGCMYLKRLIYQTWLFSIGFCFLTLWIVLQTQFTALGPTIFYEAKAAVALSVTIIAFVIIPVVNRGGDRDRLVAWALTGAEVFIIGQLFVSFFFGIGESRGYVSGAVRAFGFLGDGIAPILGYFVLKHALGHRPVRCFLAAFGLAITGGKMALILTVVGLLCLLILHRDLWRSMRVGFFAIVIAQFMLHLTFALELPPSKYFDDSLKIRVPAHAEILKRQQTPSKRIEMNLKDYFVAARNRGLSFAAGADIFLRDPLFGVGYLRTSQQIPLAASRDRFGIGKVLVTPAVTWEKVRAIHNASLRIAAELGVIGLAFFWTVCAGMIMIFLRPLVALRRSNLVPKDTLEVAAAVWGLSFIFVDQTTGWVSPGHIQLIWLSLCLGIVVAKTWRNTAPNHAIATRD